MLIGHYCAAFLAKRLAPRVPLPVYFLACQLVDIFWGVFVVLGIEKMRVTPGFTASNPLDLYFMPYTHSLLAAAAWAACAAIAWRLAAAPSGARAKDAWAIGAVVASHWLLDFLVHREDLPLLFDGLKVGLGLWDHWLAALLLELGLLWLGVIVSLTVANANRNRYLALAMAMSILQLASLVLPLPQTSVLVALQLLAIYFALAWLSNKADGRKS